MINENSFLTAFSFIRSLFVSVISYMNKLTIFGGVSVLDFNIALLILGAILPIVIITVKNWTGDRAVTYYSDMKIRKSSKKSNSDSTSLIPR